MTKCNKIQVPKDCCYIKFKKDDYSHSIDKYCTNREEQLIIDFNKNGEVIGIELLGSPKARKPCQESSIMIIDKESTIKNARHKKRKTKKSD